MRIHWVLRLAIVIAAGFAITAYFVIRSKVPSVQGAFESPDASDARGAVAAAAYGFGVTIVGVLLGSAYRHLLALRAAGVESATLKSTLGRVVKSIDFQIGLVGSPLIFGLLWQAISDISLAGITVIALQNGFASHAVLERLQPVESSP